MAACRLAMAKVWVQFPLGALNPSHPIGVWESRAFRVLREHEIVGSNPTSPTVLKIRRIALIAVEPVLVRASGC